MPASEPARKFKGTSPMQTLETVLAIENNKPSIELRNLLLVAHGYRSLRHGAPVRNLDSLQLLGSCEPVGVLV